jgi:hypothetical protein
VLSVPTLETFTRIGFAARGVMYFVIGYLALRSGRTEDGAGAIEMLSGDGPWAVLIWLMAAGFLAYGLWRLSEALIDTEGHGSEAGGITARLGGAVSGIVHLGLSFYAMTLASGTGGGGGSGAPQSGASAALDLPGGELILYAAAAALLATGAVQLVKAAKLQFLRTLDPAAARMDWVRWIGRAGYAARGLVFLTMAWFFWKAASSSSAGQAGGMSEALDAFSPELRLLVAAGLLLFGLFSLVEARYRRINDPRVVERLKGVAAG